MKKIFNIFVLVAFLSLGACSTFIKSDVKSENQQYKEEFLNKVKDRTLSYFNKPLPRQFGLFNKTGEIFLTNEILQNSKLSDRFIFIGVESSNIGFYRRLKDNSEWKITIQEDRVLFSLGTTTYDLQFKN